MPKTILRMFDRRGVALPSPPSPKAPLPSLPKSANPRASLFELEKFETTEHTEEVQHTITLSCEIYPTAGPLACTRTPRKVEFKPVIRQKMISKHAITKKTPPFGTPNRERQEKLQSHRSICMRVGWTQVFEQSAGFDWGHSALWTNPKYGNMKLCTKDLVTLIGEHQICERAHFRPKLVAPTAAGDSHRVVFRRDDFPLLEFETKTLVHMLKQEKKTAGMFARLVKFVQAGFTKVEPAWDENDAETADWLHVDCHVVFEAERVERMLRENEFDSARQATRMQMQLLCLRAGWEEGQYMERCPDRNMRYIWRHPLFKDGFGVRALYDILTDRVPYPSLTKK